MTPHVLLHHLLTARAQSNDEALVYKEKSLSYHDFAEAATRCAAALQQAGAERGDRIVIFLPRGLEECWAIFGVSMASCVFVPVNTLLKAQQIRHIVRDCGAKIVISSAAMADELNAALEDLAEVTVLLAEDIDSRPAEPAKTSTAIGEDLAAILYTSGSTGSPKGVMLSHRNLLAGARIVRTYLDITGKDRILSLLPFSFDYGLNQLLTAVEQGAATIISTFRLGDDIVRDLRDHAITGLAGVPTVWAILTRAAPSLARTPLPNLRYVTNSGGRVPQETVKALREKLPDTKIYLMYGLTEAFRSTFLPPDEIDRRPTSIGKAIPECEIFIVTAEGQRAKPGEPGILVHRGPTVSLGYWNRPEDTAKVLRPHPFIPASRGGETVCYSGDLAVEDEDGFFSFVARNDAMIKSSGYRISPTEVEESLMSTGLFREVAVIGLPDPFAGEKVHAVATAANENIDVSAALKKAAEMLAPFMIPRAIELVEQLPITANGKVDYRALVRERTDNGAHG
ncbi:MULTISPECIES: AMP-binding protein [Agrobacterium]|uniref:AMP-dependent synthetase n=1 Tax=Agrobacterium tumefaciens TaxID=358 RepID=A0AAE6EE54_AGRTU|nr:MULTISPECIES: AMP-binding protein [Agrobacterium]QCL73273.1 AMP-dependent synthetase [Agrobacterium tumefaciens]QCL78844.1 AMP-dependent synthetase [Agrobacterium tumefaciens]CUX44149.1 putative long-chain fatty acid-CoA ligase [Agrobacterium sp. NCPPB 925]